MTATPEDVLAGRSRIGGRFAPSDPVRRFWSRVHKTAGCWLWTAGVGSGGYGSFWPTRSKGVRAHRYSYELHFGPIPVGLFVCHKCDTPLCVRPDHLFPGTHQDNVDDREAKGRNVVRHGEANPTAKLTAEVVRWLRAEFAKGRSIRALAKEAGVSSSPAWQAATGRSWRHVR